MPNEIDQRLVVDLRFFGYVKPTYDNWIEFTNSMTDGFGMPQVELRLDNEIEQLLITLKPTFHYNLDEEDAERTHAMMKE